MKTADRSCRFGHRNYRELDDGSLVCVDCAEERERRNAARLAAAAGGRRRFERHPREVLLKVPNDKLRECFIELRKAGRCTPDGLAAKLGWMRSAKRPDGGVEVLPDGSRLMRALGLRATTDRRGQYVRQRIAYEMAEAIGTAMGIDPYEGGY